MIKFFAENLKLLIIILGWWLGLLLLVKINFQPLDNPSFPYYNILLTKVQQPLQTVWAYFDGAHYIRLAEYGYVDVGTQAFFPLYPLLLRTVSSTFHLPIITTGQILGVLFLILSLALIYQLFSASPWQKIWLLLTFPTSFFFVCVYTESLFLFLSLAFFLALKKEKLFVAATIAGLASATRLVGGFLALALVLKIIQLRPAKLNLRFVISHMLLALISLSGFIAYSYFLWIRFSDPLMFLHVQGMFGANRSSGEIILLPQVLYRYLNMVLTVDPTSFLYQRIWFELITFLLAVAAWFYNLKHHSRPVSLYVALSILLPTLTGTLSSFPRYLLVLLPFLAPPSISPKISLPLITFNLSLLLYFFIAFTHGSFVA